jgi:DNA polymerase-1
MENVSLNLVESVDDASALMSWLGERRPWLGVDTETGGLDFYRNRLRLVQVGDANTGWAIPWEQWGGVAKQAIEGYTDLTVMHNSKFDLSFLEYNGVKYPRRGLHDTMPMVGVVEPAKAKGLKPASERHVSHGVGYGQKQLNKIKAKNKWTWDTIPIDVPEYWSYGALDVVLTARLADIMYPKVIEGGLKKVYDVEVALAQVLCDMERKGLLIDVDYCRTVSADLRGKEDELFYWFKDELGIKNPRSDANLITWFQSQGFVFTQLTEKGNISIDGDVLSEIGVNAPHLREIAEAVDRLRDFHKMRVTYFDSFLEFADHEDRIHTQINPMKAITARMSSERPNMQNVPARKHGKFVRDAIIPAPGHKLIAADFDQIEYRIMVARAGEQQLIDAINNGQDLHTYMTSVVYNKPYEDVQPAERGVMKNATFAFLYGAGDAMFSGMAGIPIADAKAFRNMYQRKFPAIAQYAHMITTVGRNTGSATTGYLGRKQVVRESNKAYKLLNYATQGEAGDVLKLKMVHLSMTDAGPYMRLPIHDEILFEVPDAEVPHIQQVIEEVMPELDHFSVPLSVGTDVVERWGDKYE